MNDQPDWMDQQTQERLNELETSAARREVLLQQTLVDTKVTKDTNDQLLLAVKDIQNILKFQRWMFRVALGFVSLLIFVFGQSGFDVVSAVTNIMRKND
mgnify:FL=1|jgi:hypothetical protein